jgi:hypothetical protein
MVAFYDMAAGGRLYDPIGKKSFIGGIDNLAVHNVSLDESGVQAFLALSDPTTSPNLALFYDFDEGAGSVASNKGLAGSDYDIRLGRSAYGDTSVPVAAADQCSTMTDTPLTSPTWSVKSPSTPSQPTLTAVEDEVEVVENKQFSFSLEGFSSTGSRVLARIVKPPKHATVWNITQTTYNWMYSPTIPIPKGTTSDSLSFVVVDPDFPGSPSPPVNVTFTIMAINDLPTIGGPANATLQEDTSKSVLSFVTQANDIDTSNASVIVAVSAPPSHGTLTAVYRDGTEEVIGTGLNREFPLVFDDSSQTLEQYANEVRVCRGAKDEDL